METSALLWLVAIALMAIGLIGTVLPALPGVVLVLAGVIVGAWIDDFDKVPVWIVVLIGVLAVVAWVTDYVATLMGAKKAGASKLALLGDSGHLHGADRLTFHATRGRGDRPIRKRTQLEKRGESRNCNVAGIARWHGDQNCHRVYDARHILGRLPLVAERPVLAVRRDQCSALHRKPIDCSGYSSLLSFIETFSKCENAQ
jgi:Protein of unknown function (DUF456)